MRTIEQMVHSEVLCCMSHIVSTLAGSYGALHDAGEPLIELAEQAFELSCPIPDYEEAADQAHFTRTGDGQCIDLRNELHTSAQDACEANDIEPYDREVFEHWAVTQWFADKLIEQGEKVDTDFGNLCVWARTTTGQGIANDSVVQRIYAAMMKA